MGRSGLASLTYDVGRAAKGPSNPLDLQVESDRRQSVSSPRSVPLVHGMLPAYRRHRRSGVLLRLALQLAIGCGATLWPSLAPAAVITGTRTEGPNVTLSSDSNGLSATIGRWDTPYTEGLCGAPVQGTEPVAVSKYFVDIDVQDGGVLAFTYEYVTYDSPAHFTVQLGNYDRCEIFVSPPSAGAVIVAPTLFGPNQQCWGDLWSSGRVSVSQSLNNWINQSVTLVVNVFQNGYGDQSQARISNLAIRTCAQAPLTPLSASAQAFEDDPTRIDVAGLSPAAQTALSCFQAAVTNAGGSIVVTSAFRPPDYQLHLREVWDKWKSLMANVSPECADLRAQAHAEFINHGLGASKKRPAGAAGSHPRGIAFDANVSGVDQDALAAQCGLFRPFPGPCSTTPNCDPVHFQLR